MRVSIVMWMGLSSATSFSSSGIDKIDSRDYHIGISSYNDMGRERGEVIFA